MSSNSMELKKYVIKKAIGPEAANQINFLFERLSFSHTYTHNIELKPEYRTKHGFNQNTVQNMTKEKKTIVLHSSTRRHNVIRVTL